MSGDFIDLTTIRRALVVKLRHHGDVLLTSPVFTVLKNHAPHIEIDALVYADTAEMLSGHPAISQLHCIDRRWKKEGRFAVLRHQWRLLRVLRARRYGLAAQLDANAVNLRAEAPGARRRNRSAEQQGRDQGSRVPHSLSSVAERSRASSASSRGTPENSILPLIAMAGVAITRYLTATSGCSVMSTSSK